MKYGRINYRGCLYEKVYEVIDEEGCLITHVYSARDAHKEIDTYLKKKKILEEE